jgi:3-oxoacyl-[acyl-carrier-protein] synthase-3
VGFAGIGAYVPETVLTNADLERIVDTSDEWIRQRTGVETRRILGKDGTALDMAVRASRDALAAAGVDASEIDDIRVGVNTWMRFPSLATRLQAALGAERASAADVSAGCAGFVYALEGAYHRIVAEKACYGRDATALVVGVDALSHIADWTDRQTCVLFGDGAGAVVVRRVERGGILATHTHADGRYGDLLYSDPVVGSQLNGSPRDFAHETTGARPFIHMDGRRVYAIAVETMVRDVCRVIEKWNASSGERITAADVDYVYPHQANLRIVEMVAKRLGVPVERVYTGGVVRYGNTSTASIPLGYWDNRDRFREGGGRLEVDVAFGAGFASGAILRRVG